jgi:hypothetical protein
MRGQNIRNGCREFKKGRIVLTARTQFYHDGMFKFVLRCDKCTSALGVALKNNDTSVQ